MTLSVWPWLPSQMIPIPLYPMLLFSIVSHWASLNRLCSLMHRYEKYYESNPIFCQRRCPPSCTVHFLQSTQVLNHHQATDITTYSITIFEITFTYQISLQHLYKFQLVQMYIRNHGHINKWFNWLLTVVLFNYQLMNTENPHHLRQFGFLKNSENCENCNM